MNNCETSTKKIDSRKFIVWLIWLLLCIGALIYTFMYDDRQFLEGRQPTKGLYSVS